MSLAHLSVTEHTIEEERQDALYYRNPFMYEVSELALLGMLVRKLAKSEPSSLPEEVLKLLEMQESRQPEKDHFSR